jgi:hypothetical protein
MPTTLHVRDVPDGLHSVLSARAAREGMSLRGYVLGVLAEHAALPTLDEWLDGLTRLPPATPTTSGAEAVRAARESEDEEILTAVAVAGR